MIREPAHTYLTAEYEVFDGEEVVGAARIYEGVISALMVKSDAEEDFKGQILSALFRQMCEEANRSTANLSIMVPETKTTKLKRFLERFGFRQTHVNIFKRTAGSLIPSTVQY